MANLIVTAGKGSMDMYSERLASILPVHQVWTAIYQQNAGQFGRGFFDLGVLRSMYLDFKFVSKLRRLTGLIHLPNQHLGRYVPFAGSSRTVITVHDLIRYFDLTSRTNYIHLPNLLDRVRLSMDYRGIRRAAHVIAVSDHTRRDLTTFLGLPPERVTVVHHGVDLTVFHPEKGARLFQFPYVLYVGSEQPRKNLATLFRAFAALKERGAFRHLKLLKVGRAGGRESDFRQATLDTIEQTGLKQSVVVMDFVPEQQLVSLYQHAECFLFPSLYEGFGWPPLESMACGTPVIASSIGATKEVLGNAALLVNPTDVPGWADALGRVLSDGALREEMQGRGLERARRFTWERTARETMDVYEMIEGKAA